VGYFGAVEINALWDSYNNDELVGKLDIMIGFIGICLILSIVSAIGKIIKLKRFRGLDLNTFDKKTIVALDYAFNAQFDRSGLSVHSEM